MAPTPPCPKSGQNKMGALATLPNKVSPGSWLGLVQIILMQRHKNITRYTFKFSPLVSECTEPLHKEYQLNK
jgi:hypothetical protein